MTPVLSPDNPQTPSSSTCPLGGVGVFYRIPWSKVTPSFLFYIKFLLPFMLSFQVIVKKKRNFSNIVKLGWDCNVLPFPGCAYLLIKYDRRGQILPKAGDSGVVGLPRQPMGEGMEVETERSSWGSSGQTLLVNSRPLHSTGSPSYAGSQMHFWIEVDDTFPHRSCSGSSGVHREESSES